MEQSKKMELSREFIIALHSETGRWMQQNINRANTLAENNFQLYAQQEVRAMLGSFEATVLDKIKDWRRDILVGIKAGETPSNCYISLRPNDYKETIDDVGDLIIKAIFEAITENKGDGKDGKC